MVFDPHLTALTFLLENMNTLRVLQLLFKFEKCLSCFLEINYLIFIHLNSKKDLSLERSPVNDEK